MANEILEAVKKFFFPKDTVHKHWYTPVDNFQCSTGEFYAAVEKELKDREVPGLDISRVDFAEGGFLSDKRQYLRLKRERLVFDICASPFGTGYFFSVRFVELPLGIKAVEMLIFMVGVVLVSSLLTYLLGTIYGILAMLALLSGAVWIARNAVMLGFKDLDASLMKTPVIGPLYEIFLRKETYYREDTRLMYLTTVDSIVKALVEEVTAAKGIKLLKRYERKPILGDLYQPSTTTLETPPPA